MTATSIPEKMAGPRFFVDELSSTRVPLSRGDTRHALRSLRLRPGAEVTLADGSGWVGMGRLVGEEDGRAVVRVDERRRVERPIPNVSVALAPPKGERLAWAVQKLAELGVAETLLMRTERSIRAWEIGPPGGEEGEGVGRSQRVLSRLRSVAREAAMQSSQAFIMDVHAIAAMDEALVVDGTTVVMLWEAATTPLRSLLPQQPKAVRLLVGPEGGFSEQEAARAQEAGAAPASLGPNVLRTETAAVVGAALVLARYGRLG